MPPALSEIEEWALKTEARLGATADPDAQRIFAAYNRVLRCFAADIDDPRDQALSRAAALMLVQELILQKEGRSGCE